MDSFPTEYHINYFSKNEFNCNCNTAFCTKNKMSNSFVKMLDMARTKARTPFKVTSGFRCKHKQAALVKSGASSKTKSSHELGLACDIFAPTDKKRSKILWGLIQVGFTRFGIGRNWIHVDQDHNKNMNRVWVYAL